jgi:hypothetical protein
MSSRRRRSRRVPRRLALLAAVAVAALLLFPGSAVAGQYVDAAASNLANNPVYVSGEATDAPSASDQQQLRDRIGDAGVPMYIAVLPDAARNEAGGNTVAVAGQIAQKLQQPGVYAVIAGNSFGAGSTSRVLPQGVTPKIATDVVKAHQGGSDQDLLLDFIGRVKTAAAQGGSAAPADSSDSGGGAGAVVGIALAVLVVVGGGALFLSSRRKRREREQQLAEVKTAAQEDLLALSDDIRALDIDTKMPGTKPEALTHYSQAVDSYQRATESLDRARRIEDMAQVSSALEEGRYSMASTKAVLEGRPLPERRSPCFFDPRHGPSVEDVTWEPPGGVPRQVPACAADADRIHNGIEPQTREVLVNDRRVPFYQAPAYYGPWYGGYFGGGAGGFLTGLLIGNMFGGFGGFGGWGAGMGDYGDGGDGGDGGNGGDFGGGDWGGGGDFGGGDFGGGGDF